jgi:pimeloyl-ACP methyl ester carboxylesterase
MMLPEKRSTWIEPFQKSDLVIEGQVVTIVHPLKPMEGMPWAWKGEFLNAFPKTELALLHQGIHIVHMAYPDQFGSPSAVGKWDKLYEFLTVECGFSKRPALIGLSRGGLYCYQWAIANPEKVACIYGDAPVCDMRSWPGWKGKGVGSPEDWQKVMSVFGFSSEDEAIRYQGNPVDNLRALAEHHIPILHVYGDSDEVVPWQENTGLLADRYRELGGHVELIGKQGYGHHPHGLDDPDPVVAFIMKHTVYGDEKMTTQAKARNSRTFNVLDYGAKGDDKTDNTEAFSACLEAVIAAGGGRMFIPDGIYRGRIIITGTKAWITVEIIGESEPTPVFGTIGAFPFPANGTIIKSLSESGSAVISASNVPEKLYGPFSGVNVSLKNLDVRTYDNPGIGGIDLLNAAQCKLENVFVNTDVYNVQASKPTRGTVGIITPACNNAALTILRNVIVTGYHTGILVNEHTDGDNINLASNFNGLEFAFAHHASRFGRVGAQRCTRSVTVTGKHGFCIEQLDIEIAGHGQTDIDNEWQATDFNIHDPKNLGVADINYWVVLGGKGAVDTFVKSGGASIRTRRIGSSLPENESTGN